MARGDVTGWFEQLYVESERDGFAISWVDLVPNPYLVPWLERQPAPPRGRALVVGCGYDDDAELLAERDFEVTAFDVAPSAGVRCRSRFPGSRVQYLVADALRPPPDWVAAFDFVFDAYTIQVLHGEARRTCARSIGRMVAPGGRLLVVARSRAEVEDAGAMPWPLTRGELSAFGVAGLRLASLEEVLEPGAPPVPRFVADFVRRE
jgi:SAM-dependent methyltransferase